MAQNTSGVSNARSAGSTTPASSNTASFILIIFHFQKVASFPFEEVFDLKLRNVSVTDCKFSQRGFILQCRPADGNEQTEMVQSLRLENSGLYRIFRFCCSKYDVCFTVGLTLRKAGTCSTRQEMRPRLNCKINRLASIGFGYGTPFLSRQTAVSLSHNPQRYRQFHLHSPALWLAISPHLIVTAPDGSTNTHGPNLIAQSVKCPHYRLDV